MKMIVMLRKQDTSQIVGKKTLQIKSEFKYIFYFELASSSCIESKGQNRVDSLFESLACL